MEMVVMDACPTEDAVMLLMDYFLQPLLPVKSTKQHIPTLAQQEAVAEQVHAVVILYNYFHRKQHPQLEFLDFVSFCELMTILKPQMLGYMKFMQFLNNKESDDMDVEKCSVTEKCVINACCICQQLNAVEYLPTLEALPVCKVAVLLVDAEGENCFLQFSSITKGAWSLIEKEVDTATLNNPDCENSGELKGIYTRKRVTRKPISYVEGQFQKIALSAVAEATDINQADLMVLESRTVYSLKREKAAVRFFIARCEKSFNEDITLIPIRYVVDSLQGPLFKRDFDNWIVTEAVEYFHMFPYTAIISEWLSRDVSSNKFQNIVAESTDLNAVKSHSSRLPSEARVADDSDGPTSASSSAVLVDTKINNSDFFQKGIQGSFKSSMPDTKAMSDKLDGHCFLESAFEKKDVPDTSMVKQVQDRDYVCALRATNGNHLPSTIKVKEEIFETELPTISRDCKVAVENACNNVVVEYDHRTPYKDSIDVSHPPDPKHVLRTIASSGNILSQSALKVVLRKREKLSQQRREIEDEIAQCDKSIQLILSGKEDDLAIKLESLLEACSDPNLTSPDGNRDVVIPRYDDQASITPVPAKRMKVNDAAPRLENPCKELDEMCHANNWTFPNYQVLQSRGGFQGTITVKGTGFEVSEKGEWYSNLFDARESAAKCMLDKLRSVIREAK